MSKEEPRGRTPDIGVWEDKPLWRSFQLAIKVRMFFPAFFIFKLNSLKILMQGDNWLDVGLDEFANCDSNLAQNRQSRMLADLALINCYNKTSMPPHERDRILLASAKRNLNAMSYFGLTEYQKISQYIFEETFNLRFAIPFTQSNNTVSQQTYNNLSGEQKNKVEHLNALDLELYSYAKKLLFQR